MSDVVELVIRTEAEAVDYFNEALAGTFDNQSVLIKFDGWPTLDIDVEGARYHSSLPTGMLKALIDYQAAINRVYASVAYGRSAKALTEEDRKEVELVFDVHEGSTDTQSPLWDVLTKIGGKAVEKMTGKHLVITVLGGALIASGYFASVHWMDNQAAIQADQAKSDLIGKVLAQNEHLAQLQVDVSKAAMNLVKGVHDADRLTFGDATLDKEQIQALNQRGRETTAVQRIDGDFEVIQLKRFDDKWRVVLYSEVTGQVQTDLYKGQNAIQSIEELSTAFAKSEKVALLVLGKYKSGALQSATILGSAKSGLLEPESAKLADLDDEDSE